MMKLFRVHHVHANGLETLALTVSAGGLMIPSKSVTAVIGISRRPQPKKISGCAGCRMRETCNFRKAGKTCE